MSKKKKVKKYEGSSDDWGKELREFREYLEKSPAARKAVEEAFVGLTQMLVTHLAVVTSAIQRGAHQHLELATTAFVHEMLKKYAEDGTVLGKKAK